MLMTDLADGETTEMKGSGKKPYVLRNISGVYDCSCVAWKMQSQSIDIRTCKHLVKLRGTDAELERCGFDNLPTAVKKKLNKASGGTQTLTKATKKSKKAVEPKDVPEILLAEKWDTVMDIIGWWISEKLDGVRAYWDGKRFLSRLGNVYHAPEWFTEGFPEFALDGELFVGRKMFNETVSIVRRKNGGEHWKKVRYRVFDVPGLKRKVETRFKAIKVVVDNMPYAEEVKQTLCAGNDDLLKQLAAIEALGGEGLMLREPESAYETCRSTTLLKVKTFHDAEATVIGHTKGRGRHKGRCGALKVRAADGTEFKVGTGMSDSDRDNPPVVGSLITYRYQELTKAGVPRFPSFVGIRHDIEADPCIQ
jgi:DNA ligase 1